MAQISASLVYHHWKKNNLSAGADKFHFDIVTTSKHGLKSTPNRTFEKDHVSTEGQVTENFPTDGLVTSVIWCSRKDINRFLWRKKNRTN